MACDAAPGPPRASSRCRYNPKLGLLRSWGKDLDDRNVRVSRRGEAGEMSMCVGVRESAGVYIRRGGQVCAAGSCAGTQTTILGA
jgi:hypothetical protein